MVAATSATRRKEVSYAPVEVVISCLATERRAEVSKIASTNDTVHVLYLFM